MAQPCRPLQLLLLMVAAVVFELRPCCGLGESKIPHRIVKKDLRVDLSVPSLGVLLSQRLHRQAASQQELQQRSQWQRQYDGAPPDEKPDGGDSIGDQGEGTTEHPTTVRRHTGRFGQDMTVRTNAVTLPADHDHGNVAQAAQEQSIGRRWKNLMEPHEPMPADLVSDSTRRPPKLRRSNVDATTTSVQSESKRSVANATERACNCSELLTNETFSKVFYLVPRPVEAADQNKSLVKEIIRASLSKSVIVERLYGKAGCHCGCCNHTTITAAQSPSTEMRPTLAETTKTTGHSTTPTSTSMHQYEGHTQTSTATTTTTSSSRGTKCPTRVFIKLPGEELPARATDCRKLWLPDSVYKGETFWECEDRGSVDCGGGGGRAASQRTLPALRVSHPLPSSRQGAIYIKPSELSSAMRRTAEPTTTTESTVATKTATFAVRKTTPTTSSNCSSSAEGDASTGAPDASAHKAAAVFGMVPLPNETTSGWHLNIFAPYHPFGGNASKTRNATLPSTRAPMIENLRHRHYMTTNMTTLTAPEKTSVRRLTLTSLTQTSRVTSSSTLSDTTRSSTSTPTLPSLPPKNETLMAAAWPQRCPNGDALGSTFNSSSLAFVLMCAAAGTTGCNGSECELPPKRRVAHDDHRQPATVTTGYRRSTHYHLHDDDDFPWTRSSTYRSTSPEQVRLLPYRTSRNGTAFPYPFRGSDVSASRNSNVSRIGGRNVTVPTSRNGSHPDHNLPVFLEVTVSAKPNPFFNYRTRTFKSTSDKTYADIIFGAAVGVQTVSSRLRQRLAYNSFQEVAIPHSDVKRYDATRDHGVGHRVTTPGNNGENRRRSKAPDKRAANGIGYAVTVEKERRPLPPARIDLVKSSIRMNAEVGLRSSGCSDALRCAANDDKKSDVLEKIVVRSGHPYEEDEYEYYYVEDDSSSSEVPLDMQSRSVAGASAASRTA